MNTVFQIGNLLENQDADVLFLEIGQTFCSIAFISSSNKSARFIGVYAFDAVLLDDSVDKALKMIFEKQNSFQNPVISPAFSGALLIPNKFYHQGLPPL